MKPARTAFLFGLVMAVYGFASVYLVMTFLPRQLAFLSAVGGLTIPVVMLWPSRFDGGRSDGWGRRLLRRLAVVAGSAPVGVATSVLLVTLVIPGYIAWSDDVHRQLLRERGASPAEVDAAASAHHLTTIDFVGQGAAVTLLPGTVGALVTTAAGAVLFRRRPDAP